MAKVIPIIRFFDYQKTIEFYIDWLGFIIEWEDKPDNAPVYMRVSLGDIILHLSEHHGDGSPGTQVYIEDFENIETFHKTIIDKNYRYNKPGLEITPWKTKCVTVIDPVGNQLHFNEKTG